MGTNVQCAEQRSLTVSLFHFSLWSSGQSFLVLLHACLPCQLLAMVLKVQNYDLINATSRR